MSIHSGRKVSYSSLSYFTIFTDERMLLRNTVTSLLLAVQLATEELRTSQTVYLNNVKKHDDSVQQYFSHTDKNDMFRTNKVRCIIFALLTFDI